MRISEMLYAIASWLENPDNEAILLSEYDEECLKVVADSCVQAAALLKVTADVVDDIEPPEESNITSESLEELSQIATAFDASGDAKLMKQASVIDELLLTIASPPNALASRQDLEDARIETLKQKYQNPTKELHDTNMIADSEKVIEKTPYLNKPATILQGSLSTRYCPDHSGSSLLRIGDGKYQCELDKKIYDFKAGFQLNDGTKVPGGDVSNQTQNVSAPFHAIFDTRADRLESNK